MSLLILDTESTGFASKEWWGHPAQPYLMEIGLLLLDQQDQEMGSFACLIKPTGWKVPAKITEHTGITTGMCEAWGLPLEFAMRMLGLFLGHAGTIIGHQVEFDMRILRIALTRAKFDLRVLDDKKPVSTVALARQVLPAGIKANLGACHEHFFGAPHAGAHRAMADVQACRRIYWRTMKQGALLDV